jgi:hypothetical protein
MAGAAALQAQVYSVNAVGYINVTLANGFNMVANQLIAADNTVPALFAGNTEALIVYKYDADTGYDINSYDPDFEEWDDATQTLMPGDGCWVFNPGDEMTVTFVGEVPQGSLSTELKVGFNLISSQVPQEGLIGTDLGMPVGADDIVYTYTPGSGYFISAYDADFEEWDNGEPMIGVGDAFWVLKSEAATWTRDFSVNQ